MQSFRSCRPAAFVLVLATTFATAAGADKTGCEYKDIDVARYGQKPFQNPPVIVYRNGVLDAELIARYTDPSTTSIGGCGVKLRTYNGQLVGPTLRAKPGDVLNILLNNELPVETPADVAAQFEQERSNAHLILV